MSYTWQDGEIITAEKLNQTSGSSGPLIVHVTGDRENMTADKTSTEIMQAVLSGQTVFMSYDDSFFQLSQLVDEEEIFAVFVIIDCTADGIKTDTFIIDPSATVETVRCPMSN